jgi:DNA-binding XRE family transcriptional regulator
MKQKKIKKTENNLQKYRVWQNLKQRELAEKIKVSVSTIRLIESNKNYMPSMSITSKICNFFGVSYNQMFIVK